MTETIIDIIRDYLKKNGCVGLCSPYQCYCSLHDLCNCCYDFFECVPAYIWYCNSCDEKNCDFKKKDSYCFKLNKQQTTILKCPDYENNKIDIEGMLENLIQWAKNVGLSNSNHDKQIIKLMEEVGELANAYVRNNEDLVKDSIGDIIVVLNTLCLQLKLDIFDCIKQAHDTVTKRKGKINNGVFIKEEQNVQ